MPRPFNPRPYNMVSWTPAKTLALIRMRKAGHSWQSIGDTLCIKQETVIRQAKRLGMNTSRILKQDERNVYRRIIHETNTRAQV
jgi:hypothetical protein